MIRPKMILKLLNYYETIILKDCVANHGIREVKQFKELTKYLISNGASLLAIQVCYELHSGNQERELKGLVEVAKKFKVSNQILLTYNQEEVLEGIEVVPFWKYFWDLPL